MLFVARLDLRLAWPWGPLGPGARLALGSARPWAPLGPGVRLALGPAWPWGPLDRLGPGDPLGSGARLALGLAWPWGLSAGGMARIGEAGRKWRCAGRAGPEGAGRNREVFKKRVGALNGNRLSKIRSKAIFYDFGNSDITKESSSKDPFFNIN